MLTFAESQRGSAFVDSSELHAVQDRQSIWQFRATCIERHTKPSKAHGTMQSMRVQNYYSLLLKIREGRGSFCCFPRHKSLQLRSYVPRLSQRTHMAMGPACEQRMETHYKSESGIENECILLFWSAKKRWVERIHELHHTNSNSCSCSARVFTSTLTFCMWYGCRQVDQNESAPNEHVTVHRLDVCCWSAQIA